MNFLTKLGTLKRKISKSRISGKVLFIGLGILSTIWFLVRVIPKPTRATYPCMRAAAPIMSSFVIWLLSMGATTLIFKKMQSGFRRLKTVPVLLLLVTGIIAGLISTAGIQKRSEAAILDSEAYEANQPMGTANGVNPGRVVWMWNPDATDENCTHDHNDPSRGEDGYFLPKNTDQTKVDAMVDEAITKLIGTPSVTTAWDSIFSYFNRSKGKGNVGYQTDETIFIKINMGSAGWAKSDADLSIIKQDWAYSTVESTPQPILAILRHLVDSLGVPQGNIYVGDPIAHLFKYCYDHLSAEYPDVKYFDKNRDDLGRTMTAGKTGDVIILSDKGVEMPDAVAYKLYQEFYDADYLINMTALKAHVRAGVTLMGKNHFGSHDRASAEDMHPGLVAISDNGDDPTRIDYGMYRVLVDMLGHEHLGSKTVLNFIDGLWGAPKEVIADPVHWLMEPFNGDFPSSIFISQDPIAIESVCFDFLRTEAGLNTEFGNRPLWGGVDDHMEQAADPANWPDKLSDNSDFAGYDPEGDGTYLTSLGVHEHWNSADKKQYSRNLGYGYGIELVAPGLVNNLPRAKKTFNRHHLNANARKIMLIQDVASCFNDPDGDDLSVTVTGTSKADVIATVENGNLYVNTSNSFTGNADISIEVSDGTDAAEFVIPVAYEAENVVNAPRAESMPSIDGMDDDAVWSKAKWHYIDQVWINYGTDYPPSDFTGRYKIAWSESENLVYFFAETTDDAYQDGYVYNENPSTGGGYPNYDILEIFLDEDKSGGLHVFDGTGTVGDNWGTNAENAFSYHIAVNYPADGETETSFVVCDIAGTNWGWPDQTIPNYAGHFNDFIVRRDGNTIRWEFSLKIYSDAYDHSSPEDSRVSLSESKSMGFAMAYCDDDNGGDRDHFFGTDYVLEANYNDHWKQADGYGTLNLSTAAVNHTPELVEPLVDIVIDHNEVEVVVVENLNTIFSDPDEDVLSFTVNSDNPGLTANIFNDTALVIMGEAGFTGSATVTVEASDGEESKADQFTVTRNPVGLDARKANQALTIYPNPVGRVMQIDINNNEEGPVHIEVYDASGRRMHSGQMMKYSEKMHYNLGLSGMQRGLYILKVKQGTHRYSRKFIKN